MKLLAALLVAFGVLLVILENVARFVVHAFFILFFGYWGYQVAKDIVKAFREWRATRPLRKTA